MEGWSAGVFFRPRPVRSLYFLIFGSPSPTWYHSGLLPAVSWRDSWYHNRSAAHVTQTVGFSFVLRDDLKEEVQSLI